MKTQKAKTPIFIVLWIIFSAIVAHGEEFESEAHRMDGLCDSVGRMFDSASQNRDMGYPYQTTEEALSAYKSKSYPEINNDLLKRVVALIYTDPRFMRARGMTLAVQMKGVCLKGRIKGIKGFPSSKDRPGK
jgi:hypothetical protein